MSELSRAAPMYSSSSSMPPPQNNGDLLAAIDRKVRTRTTHSTALRSPTHSFARSTRVSDLDSESKFGSSPRSIANGKSFFRECRQRLDTATFALFIKDIRGLKVNTVTREEVYAKASELFGGENPDLISQLRELLYTV